MTHDAMMGGSFPPRRLRRPRRLRLSRRRRRKPSAQTKEKAANLLFLARQTTEVAPRPAFSCLSLSRRVPSGHFLLEAKRPFSFPANCAQSWQEREERWLRFSNNPRQLFRHFPFKKVGEEKTCAITASQPAFSFCLEGKFRH